jgi:hypothetical protein
MKYLDVPKLIQSELEYVTRPLKCKEIKTILNNIPTKKGTELDYFTDEYY